jgi:hypothetical protein
VVMPVKVRKPILLLVAAFGCAQTTSDHEAYKRDLADLLRIGEHMAQHGFKHPGYAIQAIAGGLLQASELDCDAQELDQVHLKFVCSIVLRPREVKP